MQGRTRDIEIYGYDNVANLSEGCKNTTDSKTQTIALTCDDNFEKINTILAHDMWPSSMRRAFRRRLVRPDVEQIFLLLV